MTANIILDTDSYKQSHHLQDPPGTTHKSFYITARGNPDTDCEVAFLGLQPYIENMRINAQNIEEAQDVIPKHIPGLEFNFDGWQTILNEFDGFLPIAIDALPEGTVVERGTPMLQTHNTDPRFPWLCGHQETRMLRSIWYPSTVGTKSRGYRRLIEEALRKTGGDVDSAVFKLHDFGARGVSSRESSAIGGWAHLTSFQGTDTMMALLHARQYYNCDMAGFSIPASEHSTMACWGEGREVEAYRHMLETFGHTMFGTVSDTWDIENACTNVWGNTLRDEVIAILGQLVVRPDSGAVIPMVLDCLDRLGVQFGITFNNDGFKMLHDKVRLIQGDGLDDTSLPLLIGAIADALWSLDNTAFGMGGGLLQKHNRDDYKWAMKCNAISYGDEVWHGVNKEPKSDPGKASAKGRAWVSQENHVWYSSRHQLLSFEEDTNPVFPNALITHYVNGFTTIDGDMEAIRERVAQDVR